MVSLLQICPSKWDVDTPDKSMGETNKEGAEMVKMPGECETVMTGLIFQMFEQTEDPKEDAY